MEANEVNTGRTAERPTQSMATFFGSSTSSAQSPNRLGWKELPNDSGGFFPGAFLLSSYIPACLQVVYFYESLQLRTRGARCQQPYLAWVRHKCFGVDTQITE